MPTLHLVILALVQGVTEFLPISSSGHLILVPFFANWPDQGVVIDVAVHVGTLGAVMAYLWRDIAAILSDVTAFVKRGRRGPGLSLLGLLIVATIPAIAAGYAFNEYVGDALRSIEVIGWTMLGFGVVLYLSDKFGMTIRRMEHLGVSDAVMIGIAQILALIPGTSRSGITMTAARMLGMERLSAARFSMLLSIPVILGAGMLKGYELYKTEDVALTSAALMAAGMAFVTALLAIVLMMAWLKRASFTPFVVYRVGLGAFLLAVTYGYVAL